MMIELVEGFAPDDYEYSTMTLVWFDAAKVVGSGSSRTVDHALCMYREYHHWPLVFSIGFMASGTPEWATPDFDTGMDDPEYRVDETTDPPKLQPVCKLEASLADILIFSAMYRRYKQLEMNWPLEDRQRKFDLAKAMRVKS